MDLPQNCLFVIGSARSGTTVLQDALNDSAGVYLLGEPDFHTDPGSPDFADRYNGMHRGWANQETKSTFCPTLFDGDAPWHAYLSRLGSLYRLVGSKIVVQASGQPENIRHLFDFQCRHFYSAHYVFTFRNPAAVAMSSREFQLATGGKASPFEQVIRNYVQTIGLYILMKRTLPHVHAVFHGDMSAEVFARLAAELGVPLDGAHLYYDEDRVVSYDAGRLSDWHQHLLKTVTALFHDLQAGVRDGFKRVQIAQNNRNLTPDHLTGLGYLQRQIEVISDGLAQGVP